MLGFIVTLGELLLLLYNYYSNDSAGGWCEKGWIKSLYLVKKTNKAIKQTKTKT